MAYWRRDLSGEEIEREYADFSRVRERVKVGKRERKKEERKREKRRTRGREREGKEGEKERKSEKCKKDSKERTAF